MSLNGTAGSTTDYVNMWHNVRSRFDALGVDNVVWAMNYTGYVTGHCLTKDLWPGNDYVDWVMWDPYPKNASWTATVGSFYNYLTANSDAEHDFLSKPWGLGEFGYVGSSQTAAYAMYDEARRTLQNNVFPKLKAYVVWDNWTSSSHDDRVRFTEDHVADPVEQEHYNAFANDPLLMGTAVPEPVDQTAPVVTGTSPEDGATVAGTVPVTGSASDEEGVESVDLLVDGDAVSSGTPEADGAVSFDWNTSTVANGTHTLRLRASDEAGNVGTSAQVSVTVENIDNEAPTTPTALTATWGRPSQATLTWEGSTDNGAVTGYRVYRDDDAIATLGKSARSHTDPGLTNLATYAYRISALDAAGNESELSEPVSVVAGDDTPPTSPTAVSAELAGTDGASVSWTAATDNAGVDAYRVYRNGALVGTVDGTTHSLLDEGLDDGVSYSYRVTAVDAAGNASDSGGPATLTTPDRTAPTAPVELKAVSTSQSVALSWKPATDNVGVKSYVVYRDGLPLTSMSSSVTSFTDNALVGELCPPVLREGVRHDRHRGTGEQHRHQVARGHHRPERTFRVGQDPVGLHGQAHLASVDRQCRRTELHDLPGGRRGRHQLHAGVHRHDASPRQDLDLHGPGEGRGRQPERRLGQRERGGPGGHDGAHRTHGAARRPRARSRSP